MSGDASRVFVYMFTNFHFPLFFLLFPFFYYVGHLGLTLLSSSSPLIATPTTANPLSASRNVPKFTIKPSRTNSTSLRESTVAGPLPLTKSTSLTTVATRSLPTPTTTSPLRPSTFRTTALTSLSPLPRTEAKSIPAARSSSSSLLPLTTLPPRPKSRSRLLLSVT